MCRNILISYGESLFFSLHVQLKHQSEDMDCFFLTISLAKKKKNNNLKTIQKKNTQRATKLGFQYLHEELGAFRHEQLEDDG